MLCVKCGIREATVHYTVCASPAVEDPKHLDICLECSATSDFKGVRELPTDFQAALEAGCRYCGGEFDSGGFDPLALLGGVRKMSVMCKFCAEEYYGFLSLKLPGFGDCDLTEEKAAVLVAKIKSCGGFPSILAELEEHMEQWKAKRKSQ